MTTMGAAEQGWLVSVFEMPCPDPPSHRHPARARFEHLVAIWERYVGPFSPDGGDFEDWIENVERLDAAMVGFGPDRCWIKVLGQGRDGLARNAVSFTPHPFPTSLPHWGAQPKLGWLGNTQIIEQDRLADRYAQTHTFQRLTRRTFRKVDAEPSALSRALVEASHARADGRVWIKVIARTKYGITSLNIPKGAPLDAPLARLIATEDDAELIHGALAHLDGERDAFLVYPHVQMDYEYRVFVIDGVPVTGAGCIESRTPLDNRGEAFDPWVARRRGVDAPEERPEVVEQMVQFAREAAKGFAQEGVIHLDIDVAMSNDGPLVVECNGILNAGLYSCRPELITRALASSPQQFFGRTAL